MTLFCFEFLKRKREKKGDKPRLSFHLPQTAVVVEITKIKNLPEKVGDPDLLAVDQVLVDQPLEDLLHCLEDHAALRGELLDVLFCAFFCEVGKQEVEVEKERKKKHRSNRKEKKIIFFTLSTKTSALSWKMPSMAWRFSSREKPRFLDWGESERAREGMGEREEGRSELKKRRCR